MNIAILISLGMYFEMSLAVTSPLDVTKKMMNLAVSYGYLNPNDKIMHVEIVKNGVRVNYRREKGCISQLVPMIFDDQKNPFVLDSPLPPSKECIRP